MNGLIVRLKAKLLSMPPTTDLDQHALIIITPRAQGGVERLNYYHAQSLAVLSRHSLKEEGAT